MVEELISEIKTTLESIAIYGINGIRDDNISELDSLINRLDSLGMTNLNKELVEFKELLTQYRYRMDDNKEFLINKYFRICSLVFLMDA